MFCQKCGTKNPDNGKFCRSCGADLMPTSEALSEKTSNKGFGMIEPMQPMMSRRGKPISLESSFGKIFMGLAFLAVSIILGFTGTASGWWFWMLIPAFGMLGSGLAQYIHIKNNRSQGLPSAPQDFPDRVSAGSQNTALPPTQTEYVSPDSRYKTGDLVPPSVTDGTTRHLELDKEGETMTLPKTEK
jgi:zinc-ribbon domain